MTVYTGDDVAGEFLRCQAKKKTTGMEEDEDTKGDGEDEEKTVEDEEKAVNGELVEEERDKLSSYGSIEARAHILLV